MNEFVLLIVFGIVIAIMLLLDLGVFNKKQHAVTSKEAIIWTLVWIGVSCLFGGFVYFEFGSEKAIQYFSAYLIEKSLSLDNIFVFVLIFSFYNIKEINKHKVLFWGILGAIVFRAIFIFSGIWLIELTYLPAINILGKSIELNAVLMVFAVVLIYAGITSFKASEETKDFSNNILVRLLKKKFPIATETTEGYSDTGKFAIKIGGVKYITPMFLALMTIEFSDIVFAVDSIPAIFAISKDPMILYTSNIFAILGLRSMYFLLASIIKYFKRLKQGIAVILIFIGAKMFIADIYHIPSIASLFVILGMIAVSIVWSVVENRIEQRKKIA